MTNQNNAAQAGSENDIAQRLRDQAGQYEQDPGYMVDAALNRAAADEIERLRREVSKLRAPVADGPVWRTAGGIPRFKPKPDAAPVADETALQAWADRFPEISDMGRLRDAWNAARESAPVADERAAFEAWATAIAEKYDVTRNGDHYMEPYTEWVWEAWQTRAALASVPAAGEAVALELRGVPETIKESDGFWRSCTGCHELNEGRDTGPYSAVLGCHLGQGCSECGGIGAIWDSTDYQTMADDMARDMGQSVSVAPLASAPVAGEAVYTLRVRGAIQAWTPTAAAFSIPDGEHQLFLSPAAPQASAQNVRNADAAMAAEYQQWIDWFHKGRDYDSFLKECVFNKPQADKDGGQQRARDGKEPR